MTPYDLITALSESRNRDYANGQPVRSPAGALFSMQVMPATARDPGFGIRPAQNNTPDEYNRVGRDYLSAMQSRYGGDPAKMWAAYNAGPGRVDQALKQGPNWLSALPAETQSYVQNNMAKLAKEQQPEPDPQRAANFSVDIPQMEQPSFGDQPLNIASNSILGNLPQLKAPSNRGKTIGAILGTLGDALMAYGGLRPEFAPYLAQQQQQEADNNIAQQRLQAEIEARKAKLSEPPQFLQNLQAYQALPDDQKRQYLSYLDATQPIAVSGPQGTQRVPRSLGPRPGTVEEGYVFLGGDPADQNNWRPQ